MWMSISFCSRSISKLVILLKSTFLEHFFQGVCHVVVFVHDEVNFGERTRPKDLVFVDENEVVKAEVHLRILIIKRVLEHRTKGSFGG